MGFSYINDNVSWNSTPVFHETKQAPQIKVKPGETITIVAEGRDSEFLNQEVTRLKSENGGLRTNVRVQREALERQRGELDRLTLLVDQQDKKIKNLIGDRYYPYREQVVEFSHGKLVHTAYVPSGAAAERLAKELNKK